MTASLRCRRARSRKGIEVVAVLLEPAAAELGSQLVPAPGARLVKAITAPSPAGALTILAPTRGVRQVTSRTLPGNRLMDVPLSARVPVVSAGARGRAR